MRSFLSTLLLLLLMATNIHAQLNNPFAVKDSVRKVVMFSPLTNIGYITKGDEIKYSDSISQHMDATLLAQVHPLLTSFKAERVLPGYDTAISRTIQYELNNVLNDPNLENKKKKILLPAYLDSLLMESGNTYGMILYQNGFFRQKGNYGKQVWKAIGVGILTMGSYVADPQKSAANMYLFLLDGKTKTIDCIAQIEFTGKDPTDPKVIAKQLQNVLDEKNKKGK